MHVLKDGADVLLEREIAHGLDAGNLLRTALKYPAAFGKISRVIMGDVDKQNVPVARLLIRSRLFIAALYNDGHIKEAIILQVFGSALEAFDSSHLSNAWRDYVIERGRQLVNRMEGGDLFNVKLLSTSLGIRQTHKIQASLFTRMLSDFDCTELFVLRYKMYPMYMQLGSDDLENAFSDLTRQVGHYMPTAKQALWASKQAERTTRERATLPDQVFKQHDSRKRRTGVRREERISDWNDGERLPVWFPLLGVRDYASNVALGNVALGTATKRRKVKEERRMGTVGSLRATGRLIAIRQIHSHAGHTMT